MVEPIQKKWEVGHDKFGRRVTLTREGHDYKIEVEPANQRDDGQRMWTMSRDLLVKLGEIANGERG